MRLFRRRFVDVVDRQLDLFAELHRERLTRLREAYARVNAAGRDESEEAFGDYADQVDWGAEELLELRDGYASRLDDQTRGAYHRAFLRGARRRFPPLGEAIAQHDDD